MKKLILDSELRSKLLDLTDSLELCDEDGKVLALVTPCANGSPTEPGPLSAEEFERIQLEPDFSTAEVLAYLEKL
ncbi:MAG: hypothetical protein L0Y72_12740 [Gemmataceae bacterium]|nr:hypothetical protein [Gemmataceae bacterium]MCI0739906.1 hypothetical protein [Gemmataceae bacterium]